MPLGYGEWSLYECCVALKTYMQMKFSIQFILLIIIILTCLNINSFGQSTNRIISYLSDSRDYSSYCKMYNKIDYDTILNHLNELERNGIENISDIFVSIASEYLRVYSIQTNPDSLLLLLSQIHKLIQKNQSETSNNFFITILAHHILNEIHLHVQESVYQDEKYCKQAAIIKSLDLLQENDYIIDIPMSDTEKLIYYWNKKEYSYIIKRGKNFAIAHYEYLIIIFLGLIVLASLIYIKLKKRKT